MPDRETRLTLNPQINIARSTAFRMWLVFGCCLLAVLQSSIGDRGLSLFIGAAALVSALLTELLITWKNYGFDRITDGSAAASALILSLLLPNYIHPIYAALGAAFAIAVVKHTFGGLGSNWMNPALGGWLFIRFSWPYAFAGDSGGITEYFLREGSAADSLLRNFLNKTIFPFLSAELPAGYIDLFWRQEPGIIADRAVLALILGTSVIAAAWISRCWLSLLYIAIFTFFVRITGDLPHALWNGNMVYSIFSGGTLAAAFILIADPSSGAKSAVGSMFLVIAAALFSLAFRIFASSLYGCIFAVVLINALTPLVYRLERRLLYLPSADVSRKPVFFGGESS